MNKKSFLVQGAAFDFEGANGSTNVALIGPKAGQTATHISLIAGANGTSKSRILASLVERLCEIQSSQNAHQSTRRFFGGGHGLVCTEVSTKIGGAEATESNPLPSRILVLSNLVMDKFHFPRADLTGDFYHYLGVRQASNLTTTGSSERATTDAVIRLASDSERLNSFQSWVDLVFGGGRDLAFKFPRITERELIKFLQTEDKFGFVVERLERRRGTGRAGLKDTQSIAPLVEQIVDLFEFLAGKVQSHLASNRKTELILSLSSLSNDERATFSRLLPNFMAASRAGFSAWPALCIEADPWVPFSQLSSGEQNILSTGAKLIAHARPGCLVAIDEPEVSLNVVWQQQYIDLVLRSLSHATGSHVIIATHSPHLISSVPIGGASIVLIEKNQQDLKFETVDANFEGWGAESVLYQVLGIPSASSFHLNRELAKVLRHIQDGGEDKDFIAQFLEKTEKLNYSGVEPLELVMKEIKTYAEGLE